QETTNRLWKSQGNYLKRFYWGEKTLWSYRYFASTIGNVSKETELHAGQHRTEQYFASTIGNVSKETATAYIRNQG
ncbi:MAG: transposase, partial [Methanosarcina sp.]|nr:transposase [Methanosarcina sp.]MDD3874544.1 transposase [Methanosarcina sp.]